MYILLETEIEIYPLKSGKKATRNRTTEIIGVYADQVIAEKERKDLIDEFLFHHVPDLKVITEEDNYWKCELSDFIYLLEIEEQDVIGDEEEYLMNQGDEDLNAYFKRDVHYVIKLISKYKVEYVRAITGGSIITTLNEDEARKYKSLRYLAEVYIPKLEKIDDYHRKLSIDEVTTNTYVRSQKDIEVANRVEEMFAELEL